METTTWEREARPGQDCKITEFERYDKLKMDVACITKAEIFLHEVTNVQCQISSPGANSSICPDEYASKVLQRCLSLPLTMRAILKKATADLGLVMVQSPLPTMPITPQTLSKLGQDHRLAFVDPHNKQYGSQVSIGSTHSDMGKEGVTAITSGYMDPAMAPVDVREAYKANIQLNPVLASLLDANEKPTGNKSTETPPQSMLSALLGDQPPPPAKQKRPRKRKSVSDQRSPGSSAKSPKRRPLDDDVGSGSNLSSVDASPSQSTTGFEPSPSHSSGLSTPVTPHTSLAGLIAEDTFPQVSPMTKLTTTVDSFIKQESKTSQASSSEGLGGSESSATQSVRVKEENSKPEEPTRKKSTSGSCLAELLESPKCESLPNNMFYNKDRSNSTSDLSSSSSSVHSKSLNDSRQDKGSPYEFKPDPVLNDSSYSSKTKSEQSSSNSYNHERNSSSSKSSSEKLNSALWDSKSDSVVSKSEEKVKEKIRKEKKESSSDDKPHEKEKITVKLNTKELTVKTSVKERSSSPHDVELTKSHSREGKSSKESSKSSREKMYDISLDNALPSSLVITRPLLQEGGRSGSPSLKIKKIRTEDGKGEKKRKSSKHDGESSKRKRDEKDKKEKSSKKRKVYNESDLSDRTGSDRYSAVEKGPTTIKITTKMQLQSSKLTSPMKSSKSLSSSNPSGLKSIKTDRLSMSPQGSKSKSSLKTLSRSKSESQALSIGRNYDSKLNKTPTIKLKPVVMPNSATSINISSKGSSSPGSAPSKSSSDLKSKLLAGPKSRKPLDAIVDKLKTKQGTTPGSVLQFKPRDSGEKKDAITKRNELDEVRKAIIQQGIKPSGATKELTSYRAGPSMRPNKLSLDSNKRSEMKGSGTPTNPIPKISQNLNKSSPASSSSKLGTIPKTSNSSSNGNNSDYSSKSNSVGSSNYGSSSGSSGGGSSDYSSRDSGSVRASGQSSSEGSRMKMSNSSNSHGPSDSTSRTENSDSKRESKDNSSASSTAYSSATVSLSHGNSTSSTSTSTAPGSSNASNSYSTSPSVASSAAATSTSSFPSSSNSALNSSSGPPTTSSASCSSSALSATSTSVANSGSLSKDQGKDSDKNRKRSVDDISERLLSRHFLDAVTKMEDGGEEEKKGSSKSASDNRTDFTELPDKVRPNGYNKSDRLNDSWSGKEDGREGRSIEGSSDFSSGSRPNCIDSPVPARGDRRGHQSMEDKENSVGREDDSVFRAPTPKGSKSGVEVTEDRLEPRVRSDSRTKPVLSPRSDVSSPEDSLIIDCPGTPKSARSPSNNRSEKIVPKPTTPVNCSDSASHHKNSSSSSVSRTTQSPTPHKLKASPCLSPATKSPAMIGAHSPGPSPGTNSQVDDDELMDVALIL